MTDRVYLYVTDCLANYGYIAKMFNHNLTRWASQSDQEYDLWWIQDPFLSPGILRRVTEEEAIAFLTESHPLEYLYKQNAQKFGIEI